MPPIKGWDKARNNPPRWDSRNSNAYISVDQVPKGKESRNAGRWRVQIVKNGKLWNKKLFDTKEQATDYAKSWMKKHSKT